MFNFAFMIIPESFWEGFLKAELLRCTPAWPASTSLPGSSRFHAGFHCIKDSRLPLDKTMLRWETRNPCRQAGPSPLATHFLQNWTNPISFKSCVTLRSLWLVGFGVALRIRRMNPFRRNVPSRKGLRWKVLNLEVFGLEWSWQPAAGVGHWEHSFG